MSKRNKRNKKNTKKTKKNEKKPAPILNIRANIHPGHLRRQPIIQRNHFVGALRFDRNRPSGESVRLILLRCLKADGMPPSEQVSRLSDFFMRCSMSQQEFWQKANVDWRFSVDAGTAVHEVLKNAFYDGSIDDLWLSVVGMKKLPSRAKSKEGTKGTKVRTKWNNLNGAPWIVNTGQTRKQGSHSSY